MAGRVVGGWLLRGSCGAEEGLAGRFASLRDVVGERAFAEGGAELAYLHGKGVVVDAGESCGDGGGIGGGWLLYTSPSPRD